MFWKKKQITPATVTTGTMPATGTNPVGLKAGVAPREKDAGHKVEKLPGPKQIPGFVGKYLTTEYKLDASLVQVLKTVVRRRQEAGAVYDSRIFDESESEAKQVKVKDYTSLDENADLILYEGWFDEASKRVEMKEKRKIDADVKLLTANEILQKIEALSQPDNVFFYQAAGPAVGGPLGKGAAIVEVNPDYPKKGRKYIISTDDVVDMKPVGRKNKLFDSNKAKDIAKWIAESHHKREY